MGGEQKLEQREGREGERGLDFEAPQHLVVLETIAICQLGVSC